MSKQFFLDLIEKMLPISFLESHPDATSVPYSPYLDEAAERIKKSGNMHQAEDLLRDMLLTMKSEQQLIEQIISLISIMNKK